MSRYLIGISLGQINSQLRNIDNAYWRDLKTSEGYFRSVLQVLSRTVYKLYDELEKDNSTTVI